MIKGGIKGFKRKVRSDKGIKKEIKPLPNERELTLDMLEEMDLDNLSKPERDRVQELIREIRIRKECFPIMDFVPQPHQQDLLIAIPKKEGIKPMYKYIMFIGGNGSGKTAISVYIDILLALGESGKKYGLPFIGESRQTLVVTKTSDSIKTNLEPYFLGSGGLNDKLKIPPQEIDKVKRDGSTQTLKEVTLKNGNKILFRTYDAGQSRLEGSNPDFIHLDELPERSDIFIELLRGTRGEHTQMLLSFTPTKFNTAVHDFFYGQGSENVKEKTFIKEVDSLENKYADHTWLEGLSEEEQKIRRYGMFVPPTGLVYGDFIRNRNLVKYISPRELGAGVKYYGALDFGVRHPMAFLLIAVDLDGHIYIFDMIYQKNMSLGELAIAIKSMTNEHGINLEYIVADTADARARLELREQHGIETVEADKFSKGENNISNRRAGIFKINELFKNNMLMISDRCMSLIKELEIHSYKGDGSENVNKTEDDALDALRYFIFGYRPHNEIKELRRKLRKNNYKQPNRY